MTSPLTLASGSSTRARLLRDAGLSFIQLPVRVDEDTLRLSLQADGAPPRDIADVLAEAKAQKAAGRVEQGFVLGCDQILSLEGRIFAKATSCEEAAQHLAALSGKKHSLFSALVIYEDLKPVWRHIGVAHLTMRPLTSTDIEAYLDKTWPDVSASVGCYHLEGRGVQLFERVDGDMFTIQGLPLLPLLSFLRIRGVI